MVHKRIRKRIGSRRGALPIEREVPTVAEERKSYLVAIPLTEKEAEVLARTAAARGETIATFLSGIVTDITNGTGDEGDLIEAYLDRSDPVYSQDSWVAFCLKNGYDVDTLEYCNRDARECQRTIAEMQAIIEAGEMPPEEESDWEPGATLEDVKGEIAFYEEQRKDTLGEKETLWSAYKKGCWKDEGGTMTEEEAMEEAREYLDRLEGFQRDRITKEALEAIAEKVTRYKPDNDNEE